MAKTDPRTLTLHLRSQKPIQDAQGRNVWQELAETHTVPADKTLIVVCDMWDTHEYDGSAQRVDEMAPRMNSVLQAARRRGVHIVHAPNDCMDFYADTPARQRMIDAPHVQPPPPLEHAIPPLPIYDRDNVSDTGSIDRKYDRWPWSRQHVAIEIDQDRDGISVAGAEIYNRMQQLGIEQYVIMGVHANMCILNRTFGLKQMVRWGVRCALVRDLTDAVYNPHNPPYVSQAEGTRLVVEFIEKFWCPTIESKDLM